jgi:hypothetical protein
MNRVLAKEMVIKPTALLVNKVKVKAKLEIKLAST